MSALPPTDAEPPRPPTFREAVPVWIKIGLLSFGGPAGQIALMHHELVDRRRWISDTRFFHALNYCMLLPGPEAQQLSIYIGWLLHRTWGGIIAGALFVLPGALALWLVSWLYVVYGEVPWIESIFNGLQAAVIGIVAAAALSIGRKALKNPVMWLLAACAFIGIYFLQLPFPLIVGTALVIGALGGRWWPRVFAVVRHPAPVGAGSVIDDDALTGPPAVQPSLRRTLRTAAAWACIWALPVVVVARTLGMDHVLFQESLFFSKAAVVTFGGAYAVLPYVAQQAVETHGWLTSAQMLDGLGLAETTPGPLILVLQYVGFVGGWNQPAPFSPLMTATMASALTTWCTFIPGFLFIFAGAPYIEALRGSKLLTSALSAITAAVVGVILNMSIWFAFDVLLPAGGGFNWFAAVVSSAVFVGLARFKWNVVPVVITCGLLGLLHHSLT